ncbi:MAG: DEAD/DEAH box helicase [Flavobacteriaceae bacterium]|nr:DEAD/DEAH box helicase [Flavobacteriaceae bacterium]
MSSSRDNGRRNKSSKKNARPQGERNFNRSDRPNGGNRPNRGRSSGRKSKIKKLNLPAEKFMHTGVPLQDVAYNAPMLYNEFPLHPDLKENIAKLGWDKPTEVQDKTFLPISDLRDVLAIANTGTGKTASFLIPLINAMLQAEDDFSALVMTPTRELALQVESEFRLLTKGMRLFAASFIGGTKVDRDVQKLQKPFHFIIGTPGRLVDLNKRKALKLEHFSVLILDEFDRMLDMGFSKDVNFITSQMDSRDQTLLFSATLDPKQQELIDTILTNPVTVKVTDGTSTAEHIDQDVIFANRDAKFNVLLDMLHKDDFEKVLIFAETKRTVAGLTKQLKKSKLKADEIHGDKSQNYRKNALNDFKKGKVNVLVATDVAARGLDISDVSHVINYEMPQDYETYIHRIGRTGRAGKKGKAYTFMDKDKA